MEKLNRIIDDYKQLFYKTGCPYFFMMFSNLQKLQNNAEKTESIESSENLSL